jgi:hypothetical protein
MARMEASKEGSNKYFGEDIILRTGDANGPDWPNYDGSYKLFATLSKNTEFEVHMIVSGYFNFGLSATVYSNVQHWIKIHVKYTDLVTNDVFYGYIFGNIIVDGDNEYLLRNNSTEEDTNFYIQPWGKNYTKTIRI